MNQNNECYDTNNIIQKVDNKIKNYHKNKKIKKQKIATIVCSLLLVSCTTLIVGASTNNFSFAAFFNHAIPYTEENAEIVNQELIVASSTNETSEGVNDFESKETATEIYGKKIIEPEIFHQQTGIILNSISNFKSISQKNNIHYFEDIAIYPTDLAILTDKNENGWNLKTDNIVNISFKEDISIIPNKKRSQPFSFGYILNGEVHEVISENSKKLNTKIKINEDGEYYFYVVNVAADQFVITDVQVET